jgi:16S rRNA processing protein RimM
VTPADADPALAIVGRVRRSHGVRGEMVIELLTESPDAVFASGARVLGGTVSGDPVAHAPELHVREARPFKEGLLVTFDEVQDRDTADRWRGRYLLVPFPELEPADADRPYLHQLVGLRVEGPDGVPIGEVVGYFDMPHALLLEIRRPGGGETVLLPWRDEFVTAVDLDARTLLVSPPVGLFD